MDAETRFNKFYAALQKSNAIWWDLIQVKFGKKDLPDIAQKLLIELHAEGMVTSNMDWKHVQNRYQKMLTWALDKVEPVPQQKAEPVVIHPEALTGEERKRRLEEWQKAVLQSEAPVRMQVNPYKDLIIQHQPPPGYKYRPLSPEEVYRKDRHFEYVKLCFDPKTGQPNSKWMPESEFNDQYDNDLL